MQTNATEVSGEQYCNTLLGRIALTLRAQEIVSSDEPVDFKTPFRLSAQDVEGGPFQHEGPAVTIPTSKVLPLGLIFHELSTNAMKYGALSAPDCRVHVTWSLSGGPKGRPCLNCEWRETNGPVYAPPEQDGFGSRLIRGTSAHPDVVGLSADVVGEPQANFASACSRSATMSAASSIPIDRRTTSGPAPAATCCSSVS